MAPLKKLRTHREDAKSAKKYFGFPSRSLRLGGSKGLFQGSHSCYSRIRAIRDEVNS
jgi:hypothetical protein